MSGINRIVSSQGNGAYGTAQGIRSYVDPLVNNAGNGAYGQGAENINDVIWTPSEITTYAWWDASREDTITSDVSGLVSKIEDISDGGSVYDLIQNTGADQPITGTRTQNGLNVLDMPEKYLIKTSFFHPASGNISIFLACEIDSIDDDFDSIISLKSNDPDYQFQADNNLTGTDDKFMGLIGNSGNPSLTMTGGPYSGPNIFSYILDFDATTQYAYANGTQRATDSYTAKVGTLTSSVRLFANRGGSIRPDGAVYEVLFVEDCSAECRQLVDGYLAYKWGLQSLLPSDHPYKNKVPLK
jgi:hypothetical protein